VGQVERGAEARACLLALPLTRAALRADALPCRSSDDDAYAYEEDAVRAAHAPAAPAAAAPPPPPRAAEPPGGAAEPEAAPSAKRAGRAAEFSRNGGAVGERYLWSQTPSEVTLSVLVPPGTRAKDVAVRLTPAPPSADAAATPRLTVAVAGAPPAVDAPLAFGVEAPAEEELDWELTDFDAAAAAAGGAPPRRAVRVTLRKASPASNMVHWWRAALAGDPGIDTGAIEERARTAGRTADARAVWAQAEAEFKRRVRERVPVEIDVGSGGEEDA
jgi:hypothetical protein